MKVYENKECKVEITKVENGYVIKCESPNRMWVCLSFAEAINLIASVFNQKYTGVLKEEAQHELPSPDNGC